MSVLCVLVCDIKFRVPAKKTHYVSDVSKHGSLLHKTHISVNSLFNPRLLEPLFQIEYNSLDTK